MQYLNFYKAASKQATSSTEHRKYYGNLLPQNMKYVNISNWKWICHDLKSI